MKEFMNYTKISRQDLDCEIINSAKDNLEFQASTQGYYFHKVLLIKSNKSKVEMFI